MNETNRDEWTEGGVVSDGLRGDSRLLKRSHQHLLLALSTFPPLGSVGCAGRRQRAALRECLVTRADRLYRPREGTKTMGRTGLFLVIWMNSTSALQQQQQQQNHAVQQKSMFGLNRHPNHSRIKRR